MFIILIRKGYLKLMIYYILIIFKKKLKVHAKYGTTFNKRKHNKNIKLSQWRHTFIKKFTFIILFSRKINLFNNTLRDLCFFLRNFCIKLNSLKEL